MASVRKVAEVAEVSRTTVSRVLNNDAGVSDKVRKRVFDAVAKLDYVPTVGRRATTAIGLVKTQGRPRYAQGHYFPRVLDGLWEAASEQQFDVVLLDIGRDKRRDETYTQFINRKGVRGLAVHTNHEDHHICRAMAHEGVPMVVLSEQFVEDDVEFFGYDSFTGTHAAVKHLIALGHRRIGIAQPVMPTTDIRERRRGYNEAMRDAGLQIDSNFLFNIQMPLLPTSGAALINQIVDMGENAPTSILIMNPMAAIGALVRCSELGIRIPDQLSVVGFDDAQMRYQVYPKLSAICQESYYIGYEAGRHLIRKLLDGAVEQPMQRCFPTIFEVHESTGPVPEKAGLKK